MARIKVIGLASGINPSYEELCAIQRIRSAALKLDARKGMPGIWGDLFGRDADWDIITKEWPTITYYQQSSELLIKIGDLFKGTDDPMRIIRYMNRWSVCHKLLGMWGPEFDDPTSRQNEIQELIRLSQVQPVCLDSLGPEFFCDWIYRGLWYRADELYTHDEFALLVQEESDRDIRHFERLRSRYKSDEVAHPPAMRLRIPEHVRAEVWRRDEGKCVRCGSRERLEFDHIIPLSRGGGNTARNLELLCETCNRKKSDSI